MPDSSLCDRKSLIAIMDSLDVGIIFVDENNDIIFINKSAEKIRQMKSEERVGTSILDCHGGMMNNKVLEVMDNFKKDHNSTRHKLIKTQGKYAYNKLQIAQQQLIQSEKMAAIGQFVAGLAHEINNPLDGIQNCLQAILSDIHNIEQTKNYAELSLEGLYKIEMLVRKLLSYARTYTLEKSEVDINFILKDILSLTSLKLKNKNISIQEEFSPDLPTIYGDHHYVEQIFVNLILNASDAMPQGGQLTVKTYLDKEGFVTIKVIDTGQGIPREYLNKIFDPFFTTKQKSNGTGLGLYLTYSFVAQHQGKVLVKSKEGKGTEFTVLLPTNSVEEKKIELKHVLL